GRHGGRRQPGATDHLGLAASLPATCFPPAVGLAQSWDPELVRRVGGLSPPPPPGPPPAGRGRGGAPRAPPPSEWVVGCAVSATGSPPTPPRAATRS
ncbi:hypothetical protein, partial [Nocardia abscessus]|uniref:hypothetical protein n=1 Tax=Nocardia abscessus TaxID=120957 RepID=UPI002454214B